jgi:hypothetical protein
VVAPYPAAYTCSAGLLLTISRIGRLGLLLAPLSNQLPTGPASRDFHGAPLRLPVAGRWPPPAGRPPERASRHSEPAASRPRPVEPHLGPFLGLADFVTSFFCAGLFCAGFVMPPGLIVFFINCSLRPPCPSPGQPRQRGASVNIAGFLLVAINPPTDEGSILGVPDAG